MADRILLEFINAGLLDLKGNDTWFARITEAADALAVHIAAHPEELPAFVYSAIDTADRPNDPARFEALSALKSVWQTFASVSIGPMGQVLQGVILDALMQNIERDRQIKLGVTLLLSSALPYLSLGAEAEVWKRVLARLSEEVEVEAERYWSVPSQIHVPSMPSPEVDNFTGLIKGVRFDGATLRKGFEAAVGPQDSDKQATSGNPHWPNSGGQAWANYFAPNAANTIIEALNNVAAARDFTVKFDDQVLQINTAIQTYVGSAIESLTSAIRGTELRSRLLWWKEAKFSPSARIEYRKIPDLVVPSLMAVDYQEMLPPLAPPSVIAFLREANRSLSNPDDRTFEISEYLAAIEESGLFSEIDVEFQSSDHALRPLIELIRGQAPNKQSIDTLTVFRGELTFSKEDFSSVLFTELQALKAIALVEAVDLGPVVEDETNE